MKRLNMWLAGMLLAMAVVAASAYGASGVGSPASVVISSPPVAQLAVETFVPDLEPEVVFVMAAAAPPVTSNAENEGPNASAEDEALSVPDTVLCGRVSNNVGQSIRGLAVEWMDVSDNADGERIAVTTSRLEPGESADLVCDLTGLPPGPHVWTGRILATWRGGEASVPLTVDVAVPEPLVESVGIADIDSDSPDEAAADPVTDQHDQDEADDDINEDHDG